VNTSGDVAALKQKRRCLHIITGGSFHATHPFVKS